MNTLTASHLKITFIFYNVYTAINARFSFQELNQALQSCKHTSEGLDGIHYKMLKHLSIQTTLFLLIYYKIWSDGYFLPSWRVAIIIPFLKSGKNGHLPQDCHPIALTSCLCKLLERMINNWLMWHLESQSLLSASQYGYRKARSTYSWSLA